MMHAGNLKREGKLELVRCVAAGHVCWFYQVCLLEIYQGTM